MPESEKGPEQEPANPTVLRRPEHCVSRRDIDPDALKVLYRLDRQGHAAYLVGGSVRDLLLGRKPKDFDVGTDARPSRIKKLFRNCFLIGRRFRLAHIRFGDRIIETSTFRRQPELIADPSDPDADLLHRDDNVFGTPEEDAQRRDFTINGLFYDIRTFHVIDHVGGLDDLDAKLVRCIGDPDIRFREDPVRMVRAVRFASRLGFQIEPHTYEAIVRHQGELEKASPPRLLEEIYKLFGYQSGEAALRLLRQTGLLSVLLPDIDIYLDESEDEDRDFWRYLAALDEGGAALPETTPELLLATLYHPMLKRWADELHSAGERPAYADLAQEVLAPITERYPVPRRIQSQLGRILAGQQRFVRSRRQRFSRRRFVLQDSFPEMLALHGFCCMAEKRGLESVNYWLAMHDEIVGDEDGHSGKDRGSRNGERPDDDQGQTRSKEGTSRRRGQRSRRR